MFANFSKISGVIFLVMALIIGGLMGGIGALVGAYTTQLLMGEKYVEKSKTQS